LIKVYIILNWKFRIQCLIIYNFIMVPHKTKVYRLKTNVEKDVRGKSCEYSWKKNYSAFYFKLWGFYLLQISLQVNIFAKVYDDFISNLYLKIFFWRVLTSPIGSYNFVEVWNLFYLQLFYCRFQSMFFSVCFCGGLIPSSIWLLMF